MARRSRIPTPSWEREHGLGDSFSGSRGQIIAIIGVVILIIAAIGIGGYALLDKYELKPRRIPGSAAITVGEREYSVRLFTNRTKMFTAQLSGVTQASLIIPAVDRQLQNEAVILQYANEKGVSATDDEIKTEIATTIGILATDANYDTRYQEELTSTGLTDAQYRDMATASVLQTKLQDAFKAALPATAESVHYRQIVVADQAKADDLKAQIEAGADFAALAAANSTDSTTKDLGGDAGWAPRGFLDDTVENLLFSLELNQVVTSPGTSSVTIYQVTEKDPAHTIEDAKKTKLATNDYQAWLTEKLDGVEVTDDMSLTTGNADKINYVFDHAALTAQ